MNNIYVLCVMVLVQAISAQPSRSHSIWGSAVVRVGDAETAARSLILYAEKHNGWLSAWNAQEVRMELPAQHLRGLLDGLDSMGLVVDRNYGSTDQQLESETLDAKIQSRRKLLDEYFAMVRSASWSRMQAIEREIVAMQAEIEHLEGQRKVLQHRLQYAMVTISFVHHDRTLPSRSSDSPFAWLNRLNVADLQEEFQ